jgi:flagellar motor protein MotB
LVKSLSSSISKEVKDIVSSQFQLVKNQDHQSALLANDLKDIISSQLQLTKQQENQQQDLIMKNQQLQLQLQYEAQLKDIELNHLNQLNALSNANHKNELDLLKDHCKMTMERDD